MSLVENLHKHYRAENSSQLPFNLRIDRLEIPDRGSMALMGPSGSGKTSLFRILLGLEKEDTGTWTLAGQNLFTIPCEKRGLGAVFQSYELFPHMTAEQNILFAARARGISIQTAHESLKELARNLKLEPVLNRRTELLSGGEKQRVAIARALMSKPKLLLLDEPFAALDADLKAEARALVKSLLLQSDCPAIIITHDLEDARALDAKIVRIRDGQLEV